METHELEKKIFDALISDGELMTLLPQGALSIYHYVSPSILPTSYPIIVYSPISDVPLLAGDNQEVAHRVTIRVHVITAERNTVDKQTKFHKACELVKKIMINLKFVRQQTTPYLEDGKLMLIYDFVKGEKSKWQE